MVTRMATRHRYGKGVCRDGCLATNRAIFQDENLFRFATVFMGRQEIHIGSGLAVLDILRGQRKQEMGPQPRHFQHSVKKTAGTSCGNSPWHASPLQGGKQFQESRHRLQACFQESVQDLLGFCSQTCDGIAQPMMFDHNLHPIFYLSRAVAKGMKERKFGRIINISSINGQKGQFGQTNYSAAKAGDLGFTKALAQESANKGVTVNCVAPGYIDTDMVAQVPEEALKKIIAPIPVGRLGKAEEIAHAVSFLASNGAAFMTGATLTMNGAQYIAT